MKRHIFILITIALLAGCGGEERASNEDFGFFIGGVEGLRLYVLDGAPPSAIFDNGLIPFSVIPVIENVGEASVGPETINPFVMARLVGLNPADFG